MTSPDRMHRGSTRCRRIGAALVQSDLEAGAPVRLVVVVRGTPSPETEAVLALAAEQGVSVRRASRRELRRISGHATAPDVVALLGPDPEAGFDETFEHTGPMWLLAGTAYPGNAGLAIRSAEVSGAAGVCVDAEFDRAGKRACLRASMRSERYMPVHFASSDRVVEAARRVGRRVIAVEDTGTRAPWSVDLLGACLLVVGGEADGVPPGVLECADEIVSLPTAGFVSSYNLQAAMAVVMAEQLRQRSLANDSHSADTEGECERPRESQLGASGR